MATATSRGYTYIPDGVAPDVPYRVNPVLDQINNDVQTVANTASGAATAAATAQTTANNAGTAASTAQTTANNAATAAADPKIRRSSRELNATASSPVDMNNLKTLEWNGGWSFRSPTVVANVANLPPELVNTSVDIDINVRPNGVVEQWAWGYGTTRRRFWRTAANTAVTSWTTWLEQDFSQKARVDVLEPKVTDNSSAALLARNAALQQRFIKRRGGSTAAAGKAVFVFRYDHDTNAFGEKVLPLHQERAMVWSLAIMSGMFTVANGVERNNLRSWTDIQTWAMNNGGELLAHGYTHRDAQTETGYDLEFVNPLAFYKTNIPKCCVEINSMAGVSVTAGYTVAYGGLGNASTVEALLDTPAGRRILGYLPVTMGYTDGVYRSLDGTVAQALPHYTMDEKTAATITGMMDAAVETGTGVCFMAHPSLLDTGNLSTADLVTILDYAKALEAAGKAEIMTVAGLTLADSQKSTQFSLLTNGNFSNGFTGWAGSAGYTQDPATKKVSGSTSAGLLNKTITLSRFGWARGAVWELAAEVTAGASDLVAQAIVEDSTTPGNLTSTAPAVTIPAGQTRTVRAAVTIPMTNTTDHGPTGTDSLRIKVGRVSGGPVADISNVRFIAK